jgi:imidazolonepropionase-like amidohydrolase
VTQFLFKNFNLLEPEHGELRGGYQLLTEGEVVKELSDRPVRAEGATVIDCGGKTLMPGLIDSHVHVMHSEVNVRFLEAMPLTLLTARAGSRMRAMLDRGFTTVRDTGGADWGIKIAVETGHFVGPRLFIAGKSIGPTGGHSDSRRRTDMGGSCICCDGLQFKSAVVDGADEVRKAAREQMRQGSDHVKIMMSGGVASPYDPLDSLQFSIPEVQAAVEEAHAFGRYVCAHAYSPEAITRAAHHGVRTIEHPLGHDNRRARAAAGRQARYACSGSFRRSDRH